MEEPAAYRALVEELLEDPRVSETQMMGMPALKLGGKLFGGRSGADLVLRIGRERADELIAEGRGSAFDPSGRDRPMKDWVMLGAPSDDWRALAQEAKEHLAS
jgi:hypothetical protein